MGLAKREDLDRRHKLARLLAKDRSQLSGALAEYRKLLAARPSDTIWRTEYRELLLWDPAHRDEAIREYNRVINLDPTLGSEIQRTRPCLVISPDEMNHNIRTVIIAPMTTKGQAYPSRVACRFKGKEGQVVLDQIRAVDQGRLIKKLGRLDAKTAETVLSVLQEMFAP